MDTVIFLRAIFWIGFIAVFVGITFVIEFGGRLVSKLKSRFHEKDDMWHEQLSLFEDADVQRTA